MPRLFVTDDVTQKVTFQSYANGYKPIFGRIQMRIANGFYPIEVSNFGKDDRILKNELLNFRKRREKNSGGFRNRTEKELTSFYRNTSERKF